MCYSIEVKDSATFQRNKIFSHFSVLNVTTVIGLICSVKVAQLRHTGLMWTAANNNNNNKC